MAMGSQGTPLYQLHERENKECRAHRLDEESPSVPFVTDFGHTKVMTKHIYPVDVFLFLKGIYPPLN